MGIRILPSLLAADYACLGDEARRAESSGADDLHIDVMDGHFVPNLNFGPNVVAMARKAVKIPLSVHLMLTNPDKYVERFAKAGASAIQIHVEADCDVAATLLAIRRLGVKPGLVMNPETDPAAMMPLLQYADEALCMTVHPGYGGQSFIEAALDNVRAVRKMAENAGRECFDVMVDGGVSLDTIRKCFDAGATAFVAGSALYRAADMAADIRRMREICEK